MPICLIKQDACGRIEGSPVCPKCGIDDRVVYPSQGDLEVALERAELRYWKTHAKELEQQKQCPAAPPVQPSAGGREVGQVFRDAPWSPEMVVLPSGKFLMGSADDDSWKSDSERPQHQVTIGYQLAMGKYLVTFEEWAAFVADGGTDHRPSDNSWRRGKRPVINVNWDDAQKYAAWLNKKLGIAEDDPTRYRLPSEAEWEYACRAGTTGLYSTPDGLMNEDRANYDASFTFDGAPKAGRKSDKTTPVGIYPANGWGLYDMHGNLWEWVQDRYKGSYRGAPTDGSAWKAGWMAQLFYWRRGLRGGSWNLDPRYLRSARRIWGAPDFRGNIVGFRLARTVP